MGPAPRMAATSGCMLALMEACRTRRFLGTRAPVGAQPGGCSLFLLAYLQPRQPLKILQLLQAKCVGIVEIGLKVVV